jgi:hypothetical protein
MAKIQVVVCTAKTSNDYKEFLKVQGLNLDDVAKKLTYNYLPQLADTETGKRIKAKIQECATFIASQYEAMKNESTKGVYIEGVSKWEEKATALAFGKTILADAVRELADLPKLPEVVGVKTTDEDDESATEEL